jgi:predicted acyltransferase
MFLLVPDVEGAFSLDKVAANFPHSALWQSLAAEATHVQWSGAAVWDLINPAFLFLVGVAMPLSVAARRQRGESRARIYGHLLLRAAALFLLPLILRIPQDTPVQVLAPLALFGIGFRVSGFAVRRLHAPARYAKLIDVAWWLTILGLGIAYLATHIDDIGDYGFAHVLSQIALASVFAFLLVGRPLRVQLGVTAAILVFYWALFAGYPLPGPEFNPAAHGVRPGDEVFTGFFAHWNKGSNPAALFDTWFLNLFPRAAPFSFDHHGLATLNFVPSIATMAFGIMAGELLQSGRETREIRKRLAGAGAITLLAGLLAAEWLCPLVKPIWTPSWTLASGGACLLLLATISLIFERARWRAAATALVVLGTNTMLLYVLSMNYRWRFTLLPQRITGLDLYGGAYGPLRQSLVFLAMMWVLAWVLYRRRIFVKF